MSITKKVATISPSLTLEITAKAKKMKQEGISVIGFGAGEPDFPTPKYIVDSAKKALDVGFTKYTPASGTVELKKAVCEYFSKTIGVQYKENQIVVSSGAKASLFHAIFSLIENGDEVLLPSPYWLTYPELIKLAGGKTVYIKTLKENGYKVTVNDLKKALTKNTKLLLLNSPSNPTGAVYNQQELTEIADFVEKNNLYVISDEIYSELCYGEKHVSIASLSDYCYNHTVVINGMSKTFSMTGWRIGFLGAPLEIAKAVSSMQSHTSSNPCSISQYASTEALTNACGTQEIAKMRNIFDERRKFMIERISKISGLTFSVPSGAFYVFVDVSNYYGKTFNGEKIIGSLSFADNALKKGVALIPGIAFGDDNCIRLSYAISKEDIAEGLNRLEAFIKELK